MAVYTLTIHIRQHISIFIGKTGIDLDILECIRRRNKDVLVICWSYLLQRKLLWAGKSWTKDI